MIFNPFTLRSAIKIKEFWSYIGSLGQDREFWCLESKIVTQYS